jgi:hypothetical protein
VLECRHLHPFSRISYHVYVLFGQVSRGESPVLGARVLVDFTVDLANGTRTRLSQESIPLLDNGYGGELQLLSSVVTGTVESYCVALHTVQYSLIIVNNFFSQAVSFPLVLVRCFPYSFYKSTSFLMTPFLFFLYLLANFASVQQIFLFFIYFVSRPSYSCTFFLNPFLLHN